MTITLRKETYSWGILRIIEKGISYSIIIGPEDHSYVANSIITREENFFIDESKRRWNVSIIEKDIIFKNGSREVKVSIKDYLNI